nr:unnamed protein product [Callosobruchus chinensis]
MVCLTAVKVWESRHNGKHSIKSKNQKWSASGEYLDQPEHDKRTQASVVQYIQYPIGKTPCALGFPPKTLDISQDNLSLGNSGIASGDTLILEEKAPQDIAPLSTIAPTPKTPVAIEAVLKIAN